MDYHKKVFFSYLCYMATADQLLLGCKSPSCPALGWRCVFYYESLVVWGAGKGRIVKHVHAPKAPTHK